MGFHKRLKRGAIAVVAEMQPDLPTAAPHDPDNRRTIAGPGSVAARLVRSAAWWVERVSVFAAFLASVLIQFIGFSHWVGEWGGRGKNARPQVSVFRAVVPRDVCD